MLKIVGMETVSSIFIYNGVLFIKYMGKSLKLVSDALLSSGDWEQRVALEITILHNFPLDISFLTKPYVGT